MKRSSYNTLGNQYNTLRERKTHNKKEATHQKIAGERNRESKKLEKQPLDRSTRMLVQL